MKEGFVVLLMAGLPVVFVLFWLAILKAVAWFGGWAELSRRYPATRPAAGKSFRMASAQIGFANYNGCLTITVSKDDLTMVGWGIFRPAHPPIQIPWTEVHNAMARKVLWMEFVAFEIGHPKITTMKLKKNVFDARASADFA